uniref:ATP synthase complex subunit 8 n=1 Tax=Malaza empyreus TaxID=2724141 RepID=A0A6H0JQP4_9NEOP|nr:ATP synthase F0 subunit 8 [Malaza empyreus]QIU83230.1 ATP synthase F0 subunit 8 [Malaza empyreus]
MPQMMPINWIISLFCFISIFILFNILNYYIFNVNKKFIYNKKKLNLKKKMTWKW